MYEPDLRFLRSYWARSQLESVSGERRRLEASRDTLQTERDQLLGDWRKAEAEVRVLAAKSTEKQQDEHSHTARLLAEVTELRRRLAAVDSSRERGNTFSFTLGRGQARRGRAARTPCAALHCGTGGTTTVPA